MGKRKGKPAKTEPPEFVSVRDLPRIIPELCERGLSGQVQAACLCASFITTIIQRLERHTENVQGRGDRGLMESSNAMCLWLVRFDSVHQALTRCMTHPAWLALTNMHEHPVRVGSLSSGSYTEAAFRWAERWERALYPLELEEWEGPFSDNSGVDADHLLQPTEATAERWQCLTMTREIEVNYEQVCDLLRIGIAKEIHKLPDSRPLATADIAVGSIPAARRTRPMSLAEAGTKLGLQPPHGDKPSRREAAAKAARRLMDSGGLRHEPLGQKFVFDKAQIPDE